VADCRDTRRFLAVAVATTAIVALFGLQVDRAAAESQIFGFTNTPSGTQAGSHPNVATTYELGTRFNQGPKIPCECNDPREIVTHAPAGVIANPHVISECTAAEVAMASCSPDSQAGTAVLKVFSNWVVVPLFRTVPQAGQAALFVSVLPLTIPVPQYLTVNGRTGSDYGLDFALIGLNHTLTPEFIGNIFWGVPGDPVHDSLRFGPGQGAISCEANPVDAIFEDTVPDFCENKSPRSSSLPIAPFVQAPTTCAGPLASVAETVAYDGERDSAEAPWPATTGCDKLSFDPSLSAQPTTTEADAPSGLAVDIKVPQYQDPETPSPSALRAASVTLPEGFTINPNAADGKLVCTDAQAGFGNEDPSHCPEYSKVGTTTLDSSALPGPIRGYVYLGEPKPGDRYRIVLTAEGFGTNVKIAGSVRPDPVSGRVRTVFENLPQAPFQEFDLHFFGSERGLLATPTRCGTYAVNSTFEPWAAELSDQTSTQFFTLASGPGGTPCPRGARPFSPTLSAGTIDNTAAIHSPFTLRLDRADGNQNLDSLTVQPPPGFLASIKGIPYCPESSIATLIGGVYSGSAELAAPACSPLSRIGSVVAAAGAGSRPLHVPGSVYLAGPYRQAPLSLLVVVPAVSGPYDLGNVVVRVAAFVDPRTAQITAVSDPLPTILDGIPLRTRMIQVDLDRDGFTLNPTNCDPFAFETSIVGDEGAAAALAPHFQVANCADLPFGPMLRIEMSGGVKRRGHPAVHALLTASRGEANLGSVTVTLPKGQLLDNSHFRTVCTRTAFAADSCPAGARIGRARVTTPLLDEPLAGAVYLRSSSHDLPDLALDLEGQIEIELSARVDSVKGRLRTTFSAVPDAPFSSVSLDLLGGDKGLLQNGDSLCGAKPRAAVRMRGQNGAAVRRNIALRIDCGARRGKRGDRRHGGHR
jgi:hypothetical protein